MKNMCTTDWQVGTVDRLHNLHVTNINTFENKPFHHLFFPIKNLVNFSKISSKLNILQIITTLLQHVVGTQCLASTLSDILPGETLVENSNTHRTSSNFNKPPTYVNCTQSFIICNSNLHMSKTSYTTCRAFRREKGSDRKWPKRRKMSEEESEIKKVYNL
jgi:hypothetical protein